MGTVALDPHELGKDGRMTRLLSGRLEEMFPSGLRRALLVLPPDVDKDTFSYSQCRAGRYANYPPYGLGLLATHLQQEGVSVRILNLHHALLRSCQESTGAEEFDFTAVITEAIRRQLESSQPDFVGVSCMFSLTHLSMVETCALLKSLAPGLPLAVGGVHVTNALSDLRTRDFFMRNLPMVDAFFLGEAELALLKFVRVVNCGAPVEELSQIIVRNGGSALHCTQQARPDGSSLDTPPAHDQLSLTELSRFGKIGGFHYLRPGGARFSTVLSNRGCRGQCTFCSVRSFNGPGVRLRSIQSVVDELSWLQDQFEVMHVVWLDDDLLFDQKRAVALFEAMIKRGLKLTWDCSNGVIASACSDEVLAAATRSGCIGLVLGVESGNPGLLRAMRKPGTVSGYLKAAELLQKYPGVNARVFLMFGFPGENRRMMWDTFRLAQDMDLDWNIIQVVQPLPNTSLFGQLADRGQLQPNDFHQVRYSLGYYGKLRDRGGDVMACDFRSAFDEQLPIEVNSAPELDLIWGYMNYHLNFGRLFREERPEKLRQQLLWLRFVTDLVTPRGGIALYSYGHVHRKLYGTAPEPVIGRLLEVLRNSGEWRAQFERLALQVEHLQSRTAAAGVKTGSSTGARVQ